MMPANPLRHHHRPDPAPHGRPRHGRGPVLSRAALPALFLAVVVLAMPFAAAPARAAEPWEYLKALGNLQERIARGDRRAVRSLPALQRYLAGRFTRYPPKVWRRRRNAEALFVWLLSGGPPRLAEWLLREERPVALPPGALAGAVAHANGHNARALQLLSAVPPESLGRVARAQLLLSIAGLRAANHPRDSLAMLARVRLLMPGTLLEEAALRRGIWLAGTTSDVGALVALASRYIRRFHDSLYVEDFLRRLSFLLVRLDFGISPSPLERLEPVLDRLTRRRRALLFAAVARQAVLGGRKHLAERAAVRALTLYPRVKRFAARARLYRDAAAVARPDPEAILAELRSLEDRLLDPRDRRLRDAAVILARAIMAEPRPAAGKKGEKGGGASPAGDKAQASEAVQDDPVLAHAVALAGKVEELLKAWE